MPADPIATVDGWEVEMRGDDVQAMQPLVNLLGQPCLGENMVIRGGQLIAHADSDWQERLPLPVLAAMLRAVGWKVEPP